MEWKLAMPSNCLAILTQFLSNHILWLRCSGPHGDIAVFKAHSEVAIILL